MSEHWERMRRILSASGPPGEGIEFSAPARPDDYWYPSLRVEEELTPYGTCLIRGLQIPRSHVHGNTPLEWFLASGGEGRAILGQDPRLGEIEPSSLLFLDLETTGLGGAGTYAFLVGVAFFSSNCFHIRQYLMRDYSEERALLYSLQHLLERGGGLVSYNGKMFDLPLLSDRFLLNRMPNPLAGLPHLDLLPSARRLWKGCSASCSLVNLEQDLLGLRRRGDVPSELIPGLYFRYLQHRKTSLLEPVFSHNVHDLLSLIALKARACRAVEKPEAWSLASGGELYGLGRIFEAQGRREHSLFCYQMSLRQGLPPHLRYEARRRLSLLLKRSGDRTRAAQIWESTVGEGGLGFDPFFYEELAKHKEHQEKDFQGAIAIVEQALEHLSRRAATSYRDLVWVQRFRHRLGRLRHKARGERWR